MESSDIKIDKDGIWYYRGAHMFRKDILRIFFDHLHRDENGKYFIELNGEIYYIDVEDTPFVVTAVYKTRSPENGCEQIEIILSDGEVEALDVKSLFVGQNNVMYCRIKRGEFPARFLRKSYYQLAEFIEEDPVRKNFCIVLNHQKYVIGN
jgi:hypothetical protein